MYVSINHVFPWHHPLLPQTAASAPRELQKAKNIRCGGATFGHKLKDLEEFPKKNDKKDVCC